MAEAVIFSIAEEIVASLAPQAIENIGKLWGDKHELEALRETVSTLQAVLDDAEEQYHQSREIKDWVDRLKGAFYDALDVFEEYNVEATRQGLRGDNKMFEEVRKFFSGSNQVAFILKMSNKVRAVKKRIETIEANRKFQLNTLPKREWRKRKETHSFACEGDIIGRDDDKETVKKFLLNSDVKGNVSILPIVGIGGLGKTTLAQLVYNDEMVNEHFELKLWVCVSNVFDMEEIVKNILARVTKEVLNHDTLEQLRNKLRGRRYLLVLDDYWVAERETWVNLKQLLVEGARGSKILITTRLPSVADITCTTTPHLLRELSEMESVDLLMQMASKGEEKQDSNLRPIGEEIARKCYGVPSVIRTVGSSLFFRKTKDEWLHFKNYKLLEEARSEEKIMPGNECCVVGNATKSIDARTRHISVGDLPLPFPCLEASCLRTLILLKGRMISEEDLHPLMQSFKKLHVLDLHDTSVKKLPRSICELKYLTYLDLSYNMWLNRLPDSIMELQNLQTLNLDGCCYLKELPRGIRKLVSLQFLGIKDCKELSYVPCGLGQLSSLHRLNCFILPKDKACAKNYGKLEELYGLNNIRGSLYIENLGHVTDTIEEYKAANLTGKQSLESLELEWGGFNIYDVVIGEMD
ncbi:putative disease resistance protein RGA4 [Eucalyptus grandis]|uniref:putative disease resistance protein RGA4 n=1 Tax=Eucalyptus grandis TaxID=71139 RepID=UPI00192EB1A8|nr:putative disease resistance protein RGA4 [Eucalyptus grandis]